MIALGRQISLVALREPSGEFGVEGMRAVFVTWHSPETRSGRILHVRDGEAVYSAGFHHPSRKFPAGEAVILHPAIGIELVKSSKAVGGRDAIPPPIERLQRICNAVLSLDVGSISYERCAVCGISDEHCHVCSFCLMSHHVSCSERLANSAPGKTVVADTHVPAGFSVVSLRSLQGPEGPAESGALLCPLCVAWCP